VRPTSLRELARRWGVLAAGGGWWPWIGVAAIGVLVAIVEAAGALVVATIVRQVTDEEAIASVATFAAVFFVLRAVVVLAQAQLQARVTESAGARLAVRIHRRQLDVPYARHLTRSSSQQLRDGHDTVQLVVREVFAPVPRIVSESIVVVALLVVLVALAPLATLAAVVVLVPVAYLFSRLVQRRAVEHARRAHDLVQVSLRALQETSHGLADIRLLGREDEFDRRFRAIRAQLARARTARSFLLSVPPVGIETGLVLFVVTFLGTTAAIGDGAQEPLAVLAAFGYAAVRARPSLSSIVQGVASIRTNAPAIDQLWSELTLLQGEPPTDGSEVGFERDIALDQVTFRYPAVSRDAVSDVSIVIAKDSHVGLVGPTGGGKTTLVDLVIGLLEPTDGAVLVDGVDLAGRRRAWHRRLGVVRQLPTIFDDTVMHNIALGVADDEVDATRLDVAVDVAQLGPLVAGMPDGLDTLVGDRGMRLSGGERQRIAIARAMYRDPDVLVLDEGTASLDTITEADLLAAVQAIRGTRTLIVIAHRLSTVRDCDQIHVVESGRVTASGTYDELLEQSDRFRRLAR
jgi:ABC-type multidrug transport system fused ATPase/permease subunit